MYMERKKQFKDTPRDSIDLFSNLTAHFAVFGQNSLAPSLYLAETLSILCNNNTTVPGSSSSKRSGTANAQRNKAGPQILFMSIDVMFVGFHLF